MYIYLKFAINKRKIKFYSRYWRWHALHPEETPFRAGRKSSILFIDPAKTREVSAKSFDSLVNSSNSSQIAGLASDLGSLALILKTLGVSKERDDSRSKANLASLASVSYTHLRAHET